MSTPRQQTTAVTRAKPQPQRSLVAEFASRMGVEPEKMLATLRATAFKTGRNEAPVTNEEMVGLLVVAQQFNLNPFTKEIYAFRDQKGGIMPIVGVDGWIRLMQSQVSFDGVEFKYDEDGEWVEATITRKDRSRPFTVREYLEECKRNTGPWQQSPRRMLRHRALIQCIRVAFGFGGIYEPDEGEAIALGAGVDLLPVTRHHTTAPESNATKAEEPFATEGQLEELREKLGKTGVPDNLVLARFEVGTFEELRSGQILEVLKFVEDNSP